MRVSPLETSAELSVKQRPYAWLTNDEAAKVIGLVVAIITVALVFMTPATIYYIKEEVCK